MPSPFEELQHTLGLRPPASGQLEIRGSEPVLPCRFPLAEMAASALAACGLAVSELWELRAGRPQNVSVDLTGAAAALLSIAALRGGPPPPGPIPTTRLYRAGDGRWIHLHGGFPHLASGTLEVLGGCADDVEAIAVAVEGHSAQELEDTLADAGMCGAMLRSTAEWARHPQGVALAKQPMVEVTKIADSDPEPLPAASRPLAGVRVLDLTRVLAGPTCGRTLAEHGADVLRISCPRLPSLPFAVADTGHGKLSAELDLQRREDLARLHTLVERADVFTQGYRSGSLARRGLGPKQLSALRPGLIYTSICCYGHEGPWRERPGWEQLAQTATGLALAHAGAERPRLVPAAACDYTTGYLAALGVLVALARRAREGGSYHVRASLCQTAMWIERHGSEALAPERPGSLELGGPSPLVRELLEPWLTQSDTPYGRLTHLGPVLRLSETPPYWARPSVPLGTHGPEWPPATLA